MSSTKEEEHVFSCYEITEECVKEALEEDKGRSAKLLSWKTENFTKKGDNYMTVVKSLKVKYKSDQRENEKSYVTKTLGHNPMKAFRDITKMGFHKEAQFYSEVAPALNVQLTEVGQLPLRIPACYYTSLELKEEVIILEDLRSRGFQMYDRRKEMDVAHITLVLKELARLHASSFLLRSNDGYENLEEVYKFITVDWINLNDESIKFSRELFEGFIENAVAILNKVGKYKQAIDWLNKLKPNVHTKVEEQLMQKSPQFSVICHGDCWNNNTLFRYNDKGHPAEVVLLDLQLTRIASLATDLNYLTFTSLEGLDRRKNINSYLKTYYMTFQEILEAGGLKMPFTYEELLEEYKAKHVFGIMSALEIVPLVVGEASEVPDYGNISEGGTDSFVQKQRDNMLQMFEKNPLLRQRFLPIFEDIIDGDIS
ncbi:uncharacterized protein [Palaemon carinicauda]|uniref:uncharacterized protein n=1 Tax=Palaemon carinicauda TaxID=392227 RepID=UPI0035B66295